MVVNVVVVVAVFAVVVVAVFAVVIVVYLGEKGGRLLAIARREDRRTAELGTPEMEMEPLDGGSGDNEKASLLVVVVVVLFEAVVVDVVVFVAIVVLVVVVAVTSHRLSSLRIVQKNESTYR